MKVIFIILLSVVLVGCQDGCSGTADDKKSVGVTTTSSNAIVDYTNGVYYFPFTNAEFANQLSKFIKANNTQLELVTICGDCTGSYSPNMGYFDVGYFVVFRKK